jgi:PIN domain nuclease of toxin-antitoxin system
MTQNQFLLDTHIVYWMYFDDIQLTFEEKNLLADPTAELYVSAVSLMEIAIKYRIGKASIADAYPEQILQRLYQDGIHILTVSPEESISFYHLSWYKDHRDPFDRMIAYQAIKNDLVLMSHDKKMSRYRKDGLLLFNEI